MTVDYQPSEDFLKTFERRLWEVLMDHPRREDWNFTNIAAVAADMLRVGPDVYGKPIESVSK